MDRSLPARPPIVLPWRRRRRHLRRELHLPRGLLRARAAIRRALARRRVRTALICALVAIPLLTGGWLWFRKSGLVAVEKVHISGVSGAQSHAIEAALRQAAHGMSTLDLNSAALREAVAQFAIVRGLHTSTHFPHTLVIAVTERPAVAALVIAGARTGVAADGLVLGPAVLTADLPEVSARWQPQPGQSVHEGGVLAELAVLGAAPETLAARVSSVYTGRHGVTVAMRNGLLVYFGGAGRAHAKWLALERVLLDEGSVGAGYIDVRLPERPAAGGFGGGVPPPVKSVAGEESTAVDPATEASVAALAEGLRANSPNAGSGAPTGANEPAGGTPSASGSSEPQTGGTHEEATAPASGATAPASGGAGAGSGGSGESATSAEGSAASAAGGAAAAPGG